MAEGNSLRIRLLGAVPSDGEPARVLKLHEAVSGRDLSQDTIIWRYLSLGKFVSLLSTGSLWFCRLDRLGDPFEGAATGPEVSRREDPELQFRIWDASRRWYVVSCWHAGQHESDAMWRLYARDGEGIALRSTIGRLEECLRGSDVQFADADREKLKRLSVFFVGGVQYVDHDRTTLEGDLPFAKYFLKRVAFSHEREVRALAPLPEICTDEGVDAAEEPHCMGINVAVNLGSLIEEVVVCPTAPDWFVGAVRSLAERYGLASPLRASTLSGLPRF